MTRIVFTDKCTKCIAYAKDGICRTCSKPCDACECTEFYRDKTLQPPAKKTSKPAEPKPAGIGRDFDDEGRLIVRTGQRNPVDVADEVAAHVLQDNSPPRLFSMSPAPVLLRKGELVPLDGDGWLLYVARRVTFTAPGRDGTRIIAPPAAVMKLIPSVVIPDLPPLDGMTATPYLDPDGSVITADGYNAGTRLLLQSGGFRMPEIRAEPGAEDVAAAVKLLTEDWLGDFPFPSDADRANALAVLLTLTGRMFFPLAPLFVIDASTPGSGKGLLVATMSLIASGEQPQVMELPVDGEEQRKKITTALLTGQDLIMWDESHVIAGRTLAAILTAERYSDRLLGGNKMISVVNRFTQVALGNNVEVWGDMKRRVVPSRLVPDTEHPEKRTDFRHPELQVWVRAHRGELLAAVLTIWRNWIALGRPGSVGGMGSFERWDRTVGGALQAAGINGFRANTTAWLSDADDDDGWGDHLSQLRARYGNGWFTVADVAAAVEAGYLKRPPLKRDPDKTLAQQIAYSYRKIRERRHGKLWLVRSETRDSASGGRTWSVSSVSSADDPDSAGQGGNRDGTDDASGTTDHRGSSVTGKSAGQDIKADYSDHPDHHQPDPGWPRGSIGEAAR